MVSGILTPETSILVAVASRNLWFTLLRGVPFSLKGPVTRSSPVSSCFRTTTLFPLWTPARRMATVPADREEQTVLLCCNTELLNILCRTNCPFYHYTRSYKQVNIYFSNLGEED